MSQFPNTPPLLNPLFNINSYSPSSVGGTFFRGSGATSTAWPSANLAVYIPFRLNTTISFNTMFIDNGATTSGNVDMGVYSIDGTRLVSVGGTAQVAGASNPHTYSVTQTELAPGVYYLAVAFDNNVATIMSSVFTAAALGQMIPFTGMASQATAYPLPATATFASNTNNIVPLVGLLTRSFL